VGRPVSTLATKEDIQTVGLLIADEVQLIAGGVGPTYKVVISRTQYFSAQTDIKTRIVACGVSLANARDLGEWMGASSHNIQFFTKVRHYHFVFQFFDVNDHVCM
jgi:pre-mRNA-splicing helicase BRR2